MNYLKASVLVVSCALIGGVQGGDNFWEGDDATYPTDWNLRENWWTGTGNYVFGGYGVDRLVGTTVEFTNAVTITKGCWIENKDTGDIVWKLGENADEDAGLTINWEAWNNLNVGTDMHGGLTIEGGKYVVTKQTVIVNGAADSFLTMKGGELTGKAYFCIGYNGTGKATVNVEGGALNVTGDKMLIGRNSATEFNVSGGTVHSTVEVYAPENGAETVMNISGGLFQVDSNMQMGLNKSTATSTLNITGGDTLIKGALNVANGENTTGKVVVSNGTVKVNGALFFGKGTNSKGEFEMDGGTFDTDGEVYLGNGTGSEATMKMSGGTFTPKKFWIGTYYGGTSSGCAGAMEMTGGTLTTDNDQDFVIGGNTNAVGTLEMKGGTIHCGKTFQVAWRGTGTLKMSGGDIYVLPNNTVSLASDSQAETATVDFTGGTIHTDRITANAVKATEIKVDGGTLSPVSSTATWLTGAELKVGAEKGLVVDTEAYGVTLCAALVPVEEGGAVTITKKGTGALGFSAETAAAIDEMVIAGEYPVALGGTMPVKFSFAEGGKLVVDISSVELGEHDLVTLAEDQDEAALATTLTAANVKLIGAGRAVATYSVSDGKIKMNLLSVEKLVWNDDNADWNKAGAWKGAVTANAYTFVAGEDEVAFVTDADEERTVLIEGEVNPVSVTVSGAGISRIKGNGTITTDAIVNEGNLYLAGDSTLILNAALEKGTDETAVTTFESGVIEIPTSVHQNAVIGETATVVRRNGWTPSYKMTGTGELVIDGCKMTVNNTSWFCDFAGTITLGAGAELDSIPQLHAENANQGSYYCYGAQSTIRMAGGRISRFGQSGGTNNEYLNNLDFVAGTGSEIRNGQSRSGWYGCNVTVTGTVTGGGDVAIYSSARSFTFRNEITNFTGTMTLDGNSPYNFGGALKSGTYVLKSGVNIASGTITIAGADTTWIADNTDDYTLAVGAGATVGSDGTGTMGAVNFADGSNYVFMNAGAFGDTNTVEGITVGSYTGTPAVAIPADAHKGNGRWVVKWRTNDDGTFTLCSEWRKSGVVIIIQ